jgi:hypothetical protein
LDGLSRFLLVADPNRCTLVSSFKTSAAVLSRDPFHWRIENAEDFVLGDISFTQKFTLVDVGIYEEEAMTM